MRLGAPPPSGGRGPCPSPSPAAAAERSPPGFGLEFGLDGVGRRQLQPPTPTSETVILRRIPCRFLYSRVGPALERKLFGPGRDGTTD